MMLVATLMGESEVNRVWLVTTGFSAGGVEVSLEVSVTAVGWSSLVVIGADVSDATPMSVLV